MKFPARFAALVSLTALAFGAASFAPVQVKISGSTTVFPIVDRAAKEYAKAHADVAFAVGQGGSGAGIASVSKGDVQIGMASRALKEKETKEFPDLVATKIGLDGIAIVVAAANPVDALSKDQLRDLYLGKAAQWKDVGGKDEPVVLFTPTKEHGTHEVFAEYAGLESSASGEGAARVVSFGIKGSGQFASTTAQAFDSGKAILAALITKPTAIGYTSISAAHELIAKGAKLKIVAVEGVAGTAENVSNGTYPISRPLLVITKGEPSSAAKEFIDYLTGSDGQKIVKDLEFIPVATPRAD